MEKTGIFYGSTLGKCNSVAEKIYQNFNPEHADLINIETASLKTLKNTRT